MKGYWTGTPQFFQRAQFYCPAQVDKDSMPRP
jgi:hypothetical protein